MLFYPNASKKLGVHDTPHTHRRVDRPQPQAFLLFVRPILRLQQLHSNPSQHNYDDLTGAVTKSSSNKAEIMLLEIFVMALKYIKNVREYGYFDPLSAVLAGGPARSHSSPYIVLYLCVWRNKGAPGRDCLLLQYHGLLITLSLEKLPLIVLAFD